MAACVVVDSSVARACGRGKLGANSPAPQCVAALKAISGADLRTAMSLELKEEWGRHAGEYARRWLSNMIARKRFMFSGAVWAGSADLERAADALSSSERRAVIKDAHVVALAMSVGRRVLSLDDEQRRLLSKLAPVVTLLKSLHWVNPVRAGAIDWLRAGAAERSALCITKPDLDVDILNSPPPPRRERG